MSKEDARAAQRKLRHINRKGAFVYLEDFEDAKVGGAMVFPMQRIYVLAVERDTWNILWVNAGPDFIIYADSPCGSVHDWPVRKVKVQEIVHDKRDGEQIRILDGVRTTGSGQEVDRMTIKIAEPDLVGNKCYRDMKKWWREYACKQSKYDEGIQEIIRYAKLWHPDFDYDFIMS